MNLIEVFCTFLAGYVVRELIGVNCLVGALTRIEHKLGTGKFARKAEQPDIATAFRESEGAE